MRHDFRAYYHVAYDEVEPAEAIDLITTLPHGSLYVAAVRPEYAWTVEREALADIQDVIYSAMWAYGICTTDEPPTVVRPRDIERTKRERERTKQAIKRLQDPNVKWEEVTE